MMWDQLTPRREAAKLMDRQKFGPVSFMRRSLHRQPKKHFAEGFLQCLGGMLLTMQAVSACALQTEMNSVAPRLCHLYKSCSSLYQEEVSFYCEEAARNAP